MATAITVILFVLAVALASIPIIIATTRGMARRRTVTLHAIGSVAVPFLALAPGILLNPRSLVYFNIAMTVLALGAAGWVILLVWAIVGGRDTTSQRGFAVLPPGCPDSPQEE